MNNKNINLMKIEKAKEKDELMRLIKLHFDNGCYDLNDIDTSEMTDMSRLFSGVTHNFDVSGWDTRNVKNMAWMFNDCPHFNCDLSRWNVGKVRYMIAMFRGCKEFNSDLSEWNVSEVRNMSCIFYFCPKFNQDLSKWNRKRKTFSNYLFNDSTTINEEYLPKYYNLYDKRAILINPYKCK